MILGKGEGNVKNVNIKKQKCIHNKQKSLCKECGGSSICIHNKQKSTCKICGGSSFCIHNKRKSRCKDCGGSSICIHNKRKSLCKECKGGSICIHNKEKSKCKDCGGSSICIHNKIKSTCKICKGGSICEHNKKKSQCKICGGSSICIHNKIKSTCKICSPNSNSFCHKCRLFITHKRTNYLCVYCRPDTPKRQKTKEIQLKIFLEKYYNITHNKSVNIDNSCNKYRPDFLIDCATFFICIECDENAHSTYNKQCELIRMNNIIYSLGLPVVFLRFNPDKKGVKTKTKQTILKSYIDYYSDKKLTNNVIEYLFY